MIIGVGIEEKLVGRSECGQWGKARCSVIVGETDEG